MTADPVGGSEAERRREGTDDDIAGWRIHYRLADDQGDDDRHIVWMVRRGITVHEALQVGRATAGRVAGAARLQAAAMSPGRAALEDPEAFQALVWMVRRYRGGEDRLLFGDLDSINLVSVWQEWVDSDGVPLDIPDQPDDPGLAQAAADLAAVIGPHVPHLDNRITLGAAAALIARNEQEKPAEAEDEGEGSAGSPTSGGPASSKSTIRKTWKRS